MQEDKKIEEYVILDNLEKTEGRNWKGKIINFASGKYFMPVVIILIAVVAFCLGRISGLQEKREPVRVIGSFQTSVNNPPNPPYVKRGTETSNVSVGEVKGASTDSSGQVVASKNGTKYHYPWCAGAKQISEKNKIFFNSIEEAKKAGYTPATNCKGLK